MLSACLFNAKNSNSLSMFIFIGPKLEILQHRKNKHQQTIYQKHLFDLNSYDVKRKFVMFTPCTNFDSQSLRTYHLK